MKRKYIAIMLGLVLTMSAGITACSNNTSGSGTASVQSVSQNNNVDETESAKESSYEESDTNDSSGKTQADYAGQTISGVVQETTENEITLQLDMNSDDGEMSDSTEVLTISVDESTAVTRDLNGEPPARPDGENNGSQTQGGQAPQGEPPAKPDGENSGGQTQNGQAPQGEPPAKPEEEGQNDQAGQDLSFSDISVGDTIEVTIDEDGTVTSIIISGGGANGADSSMPGGGSGGGPGGAPGSQAADISYSAVNSYTEDTEVSGETIKSTGTDEEAVLTGEGASVKLSDMTITRDSDDSSGGDSASFYGVGAAVLTTDGTSTVKDSTITTDAKGGAGVFSYGENSTVYVAGTTINTTQDTSGGIHAAGGGTLYAYDLDVTTNGESSAAIRSDRGGGTMVVDGGSYTSNGAGSPAIYSTADISVNNAELTANGSEAICIEGKNSIHLFNSNLTGNMPENEQNDCTWNVILYQSMSGDSVEGNSTFEMQGGTLTAKNGGMFYTTNTESTFILNDVDIQYADENDFFLKCTGNSNARGWGSSGANGADCSFTAIDQEMEGNVLWDSISELDFYMTGSSTLTGAILKDESNAGNGGDGYANLSIGENASWVVTEDSTLTSLNCAGTIQDTEGKTVTIKGSDGTVYVDGESSITITVNHYAASENTEGSAETTEWSDYAVTLPE